MAELSMNIETFGRKLVETGDLDPLYIALAGSEMDSDQKRRWLLAYWCCYHAGAASFISHYSEDAFWDVMHIMARNTIPSPLDDRWPRASERRHFRGAKAVEAVEYLHQMYPIPEHAVHTLVSHAPSFGGIRSVVTDWPQFGPWIAFKVADMLDRCLGVHVDFSDADVFVFDSPKEAALMWWEENWRQLLVQAQENSPMVARLGEPDIIIKIRTAIEHLCITLADLKAPPYGDRQLNLQEYETILCKWKSYRNGHYRVGKDIHEIGIGLALWSRVSDTAGELFDKLPQPVKGFVE